MAKVSVILRARNEWPQIAGTINSLQEDLEFHGWEHEFVVVDNCSTDSVAEILADRYRRWVRSGYLKIAQLDQPGTWNAINVGFAEATGDIIVVADAHISVKIGTMELLCRGCIERGGIHHGATQIWGDTDRIKRYGYDLKLAERFWGDPCGYLPPDEDGTRAYPIPFAGACLYAVHRDEIEKFGFYDPAFKAYGGGEPYLGMKWWMLGGKCWMDPRALCRHAFGLNAQWVTAKKKERKRSAVYQEGGRMDRNVEPGFNYLSYRAGYTVPNAEFYFNFLFAAFVIGGKKWFDYVYEKWAKKKFRNPEDAHAIYHEVLSKGAVSRADLEQRAERTLDELVLDPPWKSCNRHKIKIPAFLKQST